MAYNKSYTLEYLKKLKEIRFRVSQEDYKRFEAAAKEQGYPSMRQFFLAAIEKKIETS